ncbi:MAG: IS1634 family transposase [Gordonia sp.]|uniref:IS1634 family transposase n=2 Tax=unclassified Gordonia (in: high G+C Gram-positive bacteria) TaxID=2657482 RepID=UPI000C41FA72|nr:IS1634 family transposase [Gordonia sp. (in: high G+C Gram-positive bacteria)]MAU80773.1 IS1634 family transposase [Gordonia sp. (in: high G+C Gram-positive bacteria)]
MAFVRTVKTASGATAVQIVHSNRRGARDIEHIGSAHNEQELAALKAAAAERLAAGQQQLDFGMLAGSGSLPITSSRMAVLWDCLDLVYTQLGFGVKTNGDSVFRDLVLARIIEPTSKLDSLRVLGEVGVDTASYATLKRRLPTYAAPGWRAELAAACAAHAHLGPATLCLYDVTTLYFETDKADGFREPGFSKERRLEPQITVGLLTDATGFPLMVQAFEGNKAETATMLPTLRSFMAAHELADVTVVADAGMISDANKKALEAAGLSFILGEKIPTIPYLIDKWHRDNPDSTPPDGLVLTQPYPAGSKNKRRDHVVYYQYRADRARRSLRGIGEQIAKAEKAVAGKLPIKRNRFVKVTGEDRSINRDLEAKARMLAGWKAYATNIVAPTPEFVIGSYHQLWRIEKSFRMSKSDLAARPIFHHTRDSIDAHLTIVFAALAITRVIEARSGWSIKKFVTTARRYRAITINAGGHNINAADPIPDDLQQVITAIRGGH